MCLSGARGNFDVSFYVDDLEFRKLKPILEPEVDRIIEEELGPGPHTPEDLHGLAEKLEQVAASHGGDTVRYFRADIVWGRAVKAAERAGQPSLKEKVAKACAQAQLRRE